MSGLPDQQRSDDGVCFAMYDPFEKSIWAPSVRVDRAASIGALLDEKSLDWKTLHFLGWRVVHVQLTPIKREQKFRPQVDHRRRAKGAAR